MIELCFRYKIHCSDCILIGIFSLELVLNLEEWNLIVKLLDSFYTFNTCDFPFTLFALQGPKIHGATYKWFDGTTDASKQISDYGTYKVTVTYCQSTFTQSFTIKVRTLDVQDLTFSDSCKKFPDTLYAFLSFRSGLCRWQYCF